MSESMIDARARCREDEPRVSPRSDIAFAETSTMRFAVQLLATSLMEKTVGFLSSSAMALASLISGIVSISRRSSSRRRRRPPFRAAAAGRALSATEVQPRLPLSGHQLVALSLKVFAPLTLLLSEGLQLLPTPLHERGVPELLSLFFNARVTLLPLKLGPLLARLGRRPLLSFVIAASSARTFASISLASSACPAPLALLK